MDDWYLCETFEQLCLLRDLQESTEVVVECF